MLDTILFDLDGTLLPIGQDIFVETYFKLLGRRGAALGYEPEAMLRAVWQGTKAMMHNDGQASNYTRFWDTFAQCMGEEIRAAEPSLDDFYATDFHATQSVVGPKHDVKALLDSLSAKGYSLALATNPLFPPVAVRSRLSWIGVEESYFRHITTYENSRYCKPNLGYFQDILEVLGKESGQCMMIGNSPGEDMAAGKLGMSLFLLTDYLENAAGVDISPYPQGDYAAMAAMLEALPDLSQRGKAQ